MKKLDKILQEFLESYGIIDQPSIAEVFLILLNENKSFLSNIPFDSYKVIIQLLTFYGDGLKYLKIETLCDVYLKFHSKIDSISFEIPPKFERSISQNPKLKYFLEFNQEFHSTPLSHISTLPLQGFLQNLVSTPKKEYKRLQKLEERAKKVSLHNLSDSQLLLFRIVTIYESFRYIFGLLLYLIDHIEENHVKPIEQYLKSSRNSNSDFYEIDLNRSRLWRKFEPDLKTFFSTHYNEISMVLEYLMINKDLRNFIVHHYRDIHQIEIHQKIVHTDFGQTYSLEELEKLYYNLFGIWNLFTYSFNFLTSLIFEKLSSSSSNK